MLPPKYSVFLVIFIIAKEYDSSVSVSLEFSDKKTAALNCSPKIYLFFINYINIADSAFHNHFS